MFVLLCAGVWWCCAVGVSQASVAASRVGTHAFGGALAVPGVESANGGSSQGTASSPLLGALVVPQVQDLVDGEQAEAAVAAASTSPEAFAARVLSRTEYQNQDGIQVAQTLASAFPTLVDHQEGGAPPLPVGQKVTGFAAANVADVSVTASENAVVTSTIPMATETAPGRWQPVNLGLRDAGPAFEAANPLVAARLPKQLSEGAQLPSAGLSLTPVDENGAPLKTAPGQAEGATVLFANTERDSDTLMKLSPLGVDVSSTLRSVASPERFFYKVGMPAGARLVARAGAAAVVKEGATLAVIPAPRADDATGAPVPVTMAVKGALLEVSVSGQSNSVTYPVVVDPEFDIAWANLYPSMWEFHEWAGYTYSSGEGALEMHHTGSFAREDYANWSEHAQGYTKLYYLYVKDSLSPVGHTGNGNEEATPGWLSAWIELFNGAESQENYTLLSHPYVTEATVCHNPATCNPEGVSQGNGALFELNTSESGSTSFNGSAYDISSAFAQEKGKHSEVFFNTSTEKLDETSNIFGQSQPQWFGPHHGAFEYEAKDGGAGVMSTRLEYKPAGGSSWESYGGKEYKETASCKGIECKATQNETYDYNTLVNSKGYPLPEGEGTIRPWAGSVMPYSGSNEYPTVERTIKVDAKPPRLGIVRGLGESFTETEEHVTVEASDGEGSTPSSGIASIGLEVDGHALTPTHAASCSPGPCTATAEWAINGGELGAGTHVVTIVATDGAGNIAKETRPLKVYSASPVSIGPGSVNPESGDFALEATDVSLSGGMGSLTVAQHYDSRNVREGEEEPLAPEWTMFVNNVATLEVLPDESVDVAGPDGETHFELTSAGFESPEGDKNLTLEYKPEYEGKEPAYLLVDSKQNTTTVFRKPSGAARWLASISRGPIATDTVTDEYSTLEPTQGHKIVVPRLELAPHPQVTCVREHLALGCRGLEFVYDEGATTAKGESESEWGSYTDRLKEVISVAYNPSTKEMTKAPVAAYEYDGKGRLRAEWDPAIKPALKTTYGYDSENHVTAMTPPGQETWAFTYGTITNDPTTGRLLKVTRAPASAPLWDGALPANTKAPTIEGTPAIGQSLTVARGSWSNSPVVYEYAWNLCNAAGGECAPILGATNASYTLTHADNGHTLTVTVSATNGGGSVSATTAPTSPVATVGWFSLPAGAGPADITYAPLNPQDPDEYEMLFTEASASKIVTMTYAGKITGEYSLPAGSDPRGIVLGGGFGLEAVWWVDTGTNKIGRMTTATHTITEYSLPSGSEPVDITAGNEWETMLFTERGTNKIGKITAEGHITESSLAAYPGKPERIVIDGFGHWWLTHIGSGISSSVMELNENGNVIANYPVAGEPKDLAAEGRSESAVTTVDVAADGTSPKLQRIETADNKVTEYAMPTGTGEPHSITNGCGEVYYTATGNGGSAILGQASSTGVMSNETLAGGGELLNIATGLNCAKFFTSFTGNKIGYLQPKESRQEAGSPEPGTTVEYGVDELQAVETTKWGQKDYPHEGMAIFPPSHPTGWPAQNDTGATIYYMDYKGRTVNVVNPFGGVSTAEYNEADEVTRSLTAANRATALTAANPEEVAKQLSTESSYNETGELTDTWGPLHQVKLARGKREADEVAEARNHVHYTYDEGAPNTGEEYELVTKTTDGAETINKEEFDKRTTVTGYGGQTNLGWKLRKPTSVTVEPEGLDLTTTTKYSETTGNVTETQSPAASGKDAGVPPAFGLQFGSAGTGKGEFDHPFDTAVDAKEDVWVTDGYNDRIEKFSSSGKWIATYGKAGTGEKAVEFEEPIGIAINHTSGDVYIGDQNNNRVVELNSSGKLVKMFGKAGEGVGQFKEPTGVAVDAAGHLWVADEGNNRVEEFSETGEFEAAIGWGVTNGEAAFQICTSSCRAGLRGSGAGEFSGPSYVSVAGGEVFVSDNNNGRVEVFSESTRKYIASIGTSGSGKGQLSFPGGTSEDSSGNIYVADTGNNRVEEFNIESGAFVKTFGVAGSGPGQLSEPTAISIVASGDMYVADAGNNRVQEWLPTITGNPGAHDTQDIYYSANEEAGITACEKHPEWAGLPCETKPSEQPGTTGVPPLPVTVTTYNVWDQPETISETFGSTTRTRTTTYDEAARPIQSEESAASGTAVPKMKDKYNTSTGLLEEQSSVLGATTRKILMAYNTLGALETYTDADSNTAHYTYNQEGVLEEVTDGSEGGKSKQTYTYEEATGALAGITYSGVGAFGATYNVEGQITTESYPNGMTAYYSYNPVGAATTLEYKKVTHCTEEHEKCVWYKDAITPSIHGEALTQASTLADEPTYTYDAAGRLTTVEETPTGAGCKTRLYNYDEEGNRTSETQREPATGGACATEGGTTEWHTYDTGSRLTDPGIAYDAFGDVTKLPATDAGGSELTDSYYVDGQLQKETQNAQSNEYQLDPEGRTRATVSEGTKTGTVINHYDAGGQTVAWTSTTVEGKETSTRELGGIDGALAATDPSTGKPELLLHDLHGDIVGTAGLGESETKLLSTYNSTEFGVPTTKEQPPKYAWLGAAGISSELVSGTVTQDGVTYVPQTGAALQTQPVEIPNPVNTAAAYSDPGPSWIIQHAAWAAALQTAQAEATRKAQEGANAPAGEVPRPKGIGGEATFGFACTGSGACASSNQSCTLNGWLVEAEPVELPGHLIFYGGVGCSLKVGTLRFGVCIYGATSEHGEYKTVVCNGTKPFTAYNTHGIESTILLWCAESSFYTFVELFEGWATNFYSDGFYRPAKPLQCAGFFGTAIVEGVESLLS
jgi:YD repeat-containing protein